MERTEFVAYVQALATQHVLQQGKKATEENVQKQMLWLAALAEATEISECWDLKDIAQALADGGIPATNFDTWVDTWCDGENDQGEILDLLRLF